MKSVFATLAALALICSTTQAQTLEGSFPAEGGNITVTSVGGAVDAAGLDFASSNDGLIPIEGGAAAPFTFLLSNTSSQVTYGNLGSTVTIDGALELAVGANAGAEITASWGKGATPVAFPVAAAGGVEPTPVDLTGLMGVFSPSDAVWGGQVADGAFNIGSDGGGANQWPGGEHPGFVINGTGQKYLNFGKENTGFVVTPGKASTVSALRFWAANDAEPRDPGSYEIWGTNASLDAGEGFFDTADFTMIASGDVMLPSTRNGGGDSELDEANSYTVGFDMSAEYSSYMVVFPTLKDSAGANSMQIAEVQAYGHVVPEPASCTLLGLASICGLALRRRRR